MTSRSIVLAVALLVMASAEVEGWTLIGWNNLGMHCMDADFSVFSLLPPYNTIHAQLIGADGRLIRDPAGFVVTYEAVADPDGSLNSYSTGKTNFWEFAPDLFGVALPLEMGLAGKAMPGSMNTPQPMSFDVQAGWWVAEGIPLIPYDDQGHKNPYPLLRLRARAVGGGELAQTDIVVPVSDEMDCRSCHASGSSPAAEPDNGWINDPDPQRNMRLNILRLHDDRESFRPAFKQALVDAGYSPEGLYATATTSGTAILCARCHASAALPGSGLAGIEALSVAVHRRMAFTRDPLTGMPLDAAGNRSACYRCHPGSATRCLRGVMGAAVSADGALAIQCQSCHGRMVDIAAADRSPWLDEPTCQSCHTGTATRNNGALRYTSSFESDGSARVAVDTTFATNADAPSPGFSLFRASKGHGGLSCEACHGSTHAEFPSIHRNDNLQSLQLQGHVGVLAECDVCHAGGISTSNGGPHGLHPLGAQWVEQHPDLVEQTGSSPCRVCHGADYRGTVLSRSQADRTLSTRFGNKTFWRGFQIGCYTCHDGPNSERASRNQPAVVQDASLTTTANQSATLTLAASDANRDSLTLRIVSQPAHGRVGLDVTQATFIPDPGFHGPDAFTFAAWDGASDSNLATVGVNVEAIACPCDCDASATVSFVELSGAVDLALRGAAVDACQVADVDGDSHVSVDEIVQAVGAATGPCAPAAP